MRQRIEAWIRGLIREELARHDRETTTTIRYDSDDPHVSFSGDFAPLDPVPFYRRFS